jgi:hypothetical protein
MPELRLIISSSERRNGLPSDPLDDRCKINLRDATGSSVGSQVRWLRGPGNRGGVESLRQAAVGIAQRGSDIAIGRAHFDWDAPQRNRRASGAPEKSTHQEDRCRRCVSATMRDDLASRSIRVPAEALDQLPSHVGEDVR